MILLSFFIFLYARVIDINRLIKFTRYEQKKKKNKNPEFNIYNEFLKLKINFKIKNNFTYSRV